jgi:hypothetical protein
VGVRHEQFSTPVGRMEHAVSGSPTSSGAKVRERVRRNQPTPYSIFGDSARRRRRHLSGESGSRAITL